VLQEDASTRWVPSSSDPKKLKGYYISAVGYTFASHLRRTLKVPVGFIQAAVGGVPGGTYLSPEAIAASSDPGLKACAERYQKERAVFLRWKKEIEPVEMPKYLEAKAAAIKNKTPLPKMPVPDIVLPWSSNKASMLYHGQLGPVQPYAIRGALWYQGESPDGPKNYRNLLDALVSDWRTRFQNPDLSLLVVQITAQNPAFREKQLRFWQETPGTGLAVINDTCTADEKVHVRYKETAGRRLSLIARAITYGEKIEYSGPVYKSVVFDGAKAVVSFTHVGGGLAAKVPVDPTKTVLSEADLGGDLTAKGGELKGFTLAGEDQKFVPARAEIVGDTVVVSSGQVPKPEAVRYLWCEWPQLWTDTTLYNKNSLPAPPFRSDSWIR
jgi:sialate O-acetylesterase